jgi:hypothetical protein
MVPFRSFFSIALLGLFAGCAGSVAVLPASLNGEMSDTQILRYLKLDPGAMERRTEYFMDSSQSTYKDRLNEILIVRSPGEVTVSRLKPADQIQHWNLPTT